MDVAGGRPPLAAAILDQSPRPSPSPPVRGLCSTPQPSLLSLTECDDSPGKLFPRSKFRISRRASGRMIHVPIRCNLTPFSPPFPHSLHPAWVDQAPPNTLSMSFHARWPRRHRGGPD